MTGVTVGIVVYDTAPHLLELCIASIERERSASNLEIEIVVVDNSSSAPLRDRFAQRTDKWIPSENNGFAVSANRCVAEASMEFVLLLNPDASLGDGAMLSLLRNYSPGHVLCGWLTTPAGSVQVDALMFWWSSTERLIKRRWVARAIERTAVSSDVVRVSKVSGGATFGLRKDLLALGPYDEDFFLYGEDADFSHRFRRSGGVLEAVPSARVEHAAASSQEGHSTLVETARVDAAVRLTAKHLPWALDMLCRVDLLVVTILGAIVSRRTSSTSSRTRLERIRVLRRWNTRRHVARFRP